MPFSPQYIEHFTNPRGIGEVSFPDLVSDVQHEGGGCFDRIHLTVRLDAGRMVEAKFRARACSGSIAACSALVEIVSGLGLAEARLIDADVIAKHLGGVPEKKRHSVELAALALQKALADGHLVGQ